MEVILSELEPREVMPGYFGKIIHGANMSIVFWDILKGAVVPDHAHINEQIMTVLEGRFEFHVSGNARMYVPGEVVVIPPNATHGGRALTACRIMDVFSPVREEYRF